MARTLGGVELTDRVCPSIVANKMETILFSARTIISRNVYYHIEILEAVSTTW